MIVKNESKIITRLFDSVLPIIDCYCICDTGSSDNTVEIIQRYFELKGIPGKIVHEPFVDFAHNRNFALQSCINMSDYILLLDADMILEIKPGFKKSLINNFDSLLILQGSDEFYYNNARIIKNDTRFLYVGVTHEYISTPPNSKTANIEKDILFIRDIGDGGAKSDKLSRDIRLLKKGIEEDPRNDRYHFYLANSYYDNGKYEEAIEIYKKRIELGGWDQELWYSHYRIGLSYKNQGKTEAAISAWLDGYELIQNRIENIYEIIQHYRFMGKSNLAYHFYKMAKDALKLVTNKDSYLFLNNDIYTYKLDYEYSIFSNYLGVSKINDEIISIFNHCNESYIIDNTLSNMKFYKEVLTPIGLIDLTNSFISKIGGSEVKDRRFYSSSASIIRNSLDKNDGYLMNVRFVNYIIDNNGNYHDCDDHIITLNKYVYLSNSFNVINEKIFDSNFDGRRYIGIEDLRIFQSANGIDRELQFVGTGLHQNGNIGICTGKYDIRNQCINPIEIKPNFSNSACEKNWVFVDIENEPRVIYEWYPLHICKINEESRTLETVKKIENVPKIFKYMRGSTCGCEIGAEIWFINHIVSYEQPRHYYHLFTVFDKQMNLLRYSAPFKFEGECIEYCIGLVVETDRVVVSYSTWDRTSKLAIYDRKYVDSIVKYAYVTSK